MAWGRRSLPSSSCPGHPLSLVHPDGVIADRQGGRSNDASSVNQAISFLRDRNEDSVIDFPSAAVVQLSQLRREYDRRKLKFSSPRSLLLNYLHVFCGCQRSKGKRREASSLSRKYATCIVNVKFNSLYNLSLNYNFLITTRNSNSNIYFADINSSFT